MGNGKLFGTFVNKPESCSFPALQVESAANFGLRTSEFLKALISDAMRDPVLIGHPAGVLSGSLPELIAAARTVAVLELPSVVVAHRGRQIVSHSLPPEALGRIGGRNLKPLPKPSLTSKPPDDPTVKIPEGSSDEPEWMSTLRRALDGNALDYPLLDKLASGEIMTASLLAQFALSIAKPRNGERVGHGSGKCGPSSVRRYCLLIATKIIPRLGSLPATDPTADAWEDAIEQILDEDEFYFRKRYTANPSSNAETHSRPLVKAIRHWLHFLDHHFAPKSRGEGDLNDEGNLLSIERKLPVLGLVKVDASFITVDEYQRALRSLVRSPGSTDEREARRIALILGYRCGLRKAEAAGLRVVILAEQRDRIPFDVPSQALRARLIFN